MTAKKAPSLGLVVSIPCSRGCGWHRDYHDSAEWKDRITHHPVYGKVTGEALMTRDIASHDCSENAAALRKLRHQDDATHLIPIGA
jgi:hypothetical protein